APAGARSGGLAAPRSATERSGPPPSTVPPFGPTVGAASTTPPDGASGSCTTLEQAHEKSAMSQLARKRQLQAVERRPLVGGIAARLDAETTRLEARGRDALFDEVEPHRHRAAVGDLLIVGRVRGRRDERVDP